MILKDKNLYYVGGVVRDELLNCKSFDIDYCYEGDAIEFAKTFNILKRNESFGTVRILLENKEIDIASTRVETYPKAGHLPLVGKIGCSLREDLARRDFTINAMAKNTITNQIIDYYDGQKDIQEKRIRVLHDKSFIDDPSRIIRALKFSVRFGFDLDEHTRGLQIAYLNNINYDVSYHRLKKELKELFSLDNCCLFDKFVKEGIYKLLGENVKLPELLDTPYNLIKLFKPENAYMVYLGLFDLSKFELTSEELNILKAYAKIKNVVPQNDIESYNTFINQPLESILLYALTINKNIAIDFLSRLSFINIQITGKQLKKMGIEEGPVYKKIFEALLEYKINHMNSTLDDEIFFVKSNFIN